MDCKEINNRINSELCEDIISKLSDISLLETYKKQKSVKNKINKLKDILIKFDIDIKKQESILNEYILELIPPGTKGVIRGNKFNEYVKEYITNLELNSDIFEVNFEKKHSEFKTSEIPDWYIYNKKTNKILIGMNQLDLWKGGQQYNRGSKYLINNKHNTSNSKLICVVCNKTNVKSNKNKQYKLFDIGFTNNTLCYINNLKNIIEKYFELK